LLETKQPLLAAASLGKYFLNFFQKKAVDFINGFDRLSAASTGKPLKIAG